MMKCWNDDYGDDDDDHKDDDHKDDDHVAMAIWDEMGRDGMRQTLTMRIKRDLVVGTRPTYPPTYSLRLRVYTATHTKTRATHWQWQGMAACLALPCPAMLEDTSPTSPSNSLYLSIHLPVNRIESNRIEPNRMGRCKAEKSKPPPSAPPTGAIHWKLGLGKPRGIIVKTFGNE